MVSVDEFTIPPDAVPLGILSAAFPEVTVEPERAVSTDHALVSYVRVRGASPRKEQTDLDHV